MIEHARFDAFVEDLVAGRRAECLRHVHELLDGGLAIRALYEELFTAALYEVGARWERGVISVAVEHRATAITEALLSEVYPRALARPSLGRTAVVSCVTDEFHQVGGRIVADVLALHGWDVRFLGAGTSLTQLLTAVRAPRPDLLALSVSIGFHLPLAREAVLAVRSSDPTLPIFIGGRAFTAAPADYAREVTQALRAIDHVELVTSLEGLEARIRAWEAPR